MRNALLLLAVIAPSIASAFPNKSSLPGWRCYFSNTDMVFIDKEKGDYFITDGEFDLYPFVRFRDIDFATEMAEFLGQFRQAGEIHVCQFNPTYNKPYFSYVYGLRDRAVPREKCISINSVVVRYDSFLKKNYISTSSNTKLIVGPFEKAQDAQDARFVIEYMKFHQFCTVEDSNFVYFKRRL